MRIARRFFLGAAAAAALVRPSMASVQPVAVPASPAPLPPVPSPTGCWQDMARQIPAIKVGDPVAYVENRFMSDGVPKPLIQPDPNCRPTLGTQWQGQHYIEFNGKEQHLCAEDVPMPKPMLRAGQGAQVFEVHLSSSTSSQALATVEQEMMKKWLK